MGILIKGRQGNTAMKEDIELIRAILKGDINSFEEIVARYEMGIVRFIYNMIRNKEASEDLTQEVFINAYKKLHTFRQEYKFSTWLYQIAKNKCIDYIRKYGKAQEVSMEEACISSYELSPEGYMEYKETRHIVEKFISTLGDLDKQILILRYSQEHLTFGDIAALLNISESSVKKRYYKIHDKFEAYEDKYSFAGKEGYCEVR
jgi:RNA polymerase sigma-70 factor (ECF subfamily)